MSVQITYILSSIPSSEKENPKNVCFLRTNNHFCAKQKGKLQNLPKESLFYSFIPGMIPFIILYNSKTKNSSEEVFNET